MQIEQLMEEWARWCAVREDNGLGYKSSSLNFIFERKVIKERVSEIPYGVDVDSVMSAIDQAVNRLPYIRKQVVIAEYRQIGSREVKAKHLNPPLQLGSFRNQLNLAHVAISRLPLVAKLL